MGLRVAEGTGLGVEVGLEAEEELGEAGEFGQTA